MGHGDTSCDPHLHQTVQEPTLHYLTRSVRRRAAWFKSGSRRQSTLISSNPVSVKLNSIPLQPADTPSYIFKDLPYVAFAVQNANNVEGDCLQSVINPNSLKSSDRP